MAGLSPIFTPPSSWCPGMVCLSGNTNSDLNNTWTLCDLQKVDSVSPGAESRSMQDSCMLGVHPLTDTRKHAPHGCRWPRPPFQLHTLWAVPEDCFSAARLYFPSATARVTLDASFHFLINILYFQSLSSVRNTSPASQVEQNCFHTCNKCEEPIQAY